MLTLSSRNASEVLQLSPLAISFPECSDPDQRLSLQPDFTSWTNRKRETGCDPRLSELANSITWLSNQAQEQQQEQRWNSETSFEPISSWIPMTSSCYESGDSLDSFASPSSTTTTSSFYSLPPTPPATPPNSAQDWLPPASSSSIPAKIGGRFSCDSCSKVFGDRAHLAEHHRYRHSDDRPHRCPECSKGFKSKSNLNQHIRTSHERPRFDCQVRLNFLLRFWNPNCCLCMQQLYAMHFPCDCIGYWTLAINDVITLIIYDTIHWSKCMYKWHLASMKKWYVFI